MKGIFSNIKQSPFVKNVSVLATGTVIVQSVSILISPVLSRLYNPGDYGLFAVFNSVLSILLVICCFRFELAIVIPKEDLEAKHLLKLSLVICFLFSMAVLLIVVFFGNSVASMLGNESLTFWLYLIPPVLIAAGSVQAFTYWFNRIKFYKAITGLRISQSLLYSAFSLGFGFLKLSSFGLIVSSIISQVTPALYLVKKYYGRIGDLPGVGRIKKSFLKFKEFPAYNLPAALMDTFSLNLIIILLNNFFSETITGSYSFSMRLLSVPAVVIGASVGQVFFQRVSEAYNNSQPIKGLIYKSWSALALISIVPTMLVIFSGPEIFTFIFGDRWVLAGEISQYLAILTFFTFVSSPTSSIFIVIKQQRIGFLFSIIVLIYRPASIIYGFLTNDFIAGIQLYVVLEIIQIVIFNLIMLSKLREANSDRR